MRIAEELLPEFYGRVHELSLAEKEELRVARNKIATKYWQLRQSLNEEFRKKQKEVDGQGKVSDSVVQSINVVVGLVRPDRRPQVGDPDAWR